MLLLLFHLGNDHYALDAAQVAEVLPLVGIRRIPQAPPGVAGIFDCRGVPVPVIDLSQLMLGRPVARCLSTRIIVVDYPDQSGGLRRLGLIAEQVTETMRREQTDFVDAGVNNEGASYLGPVAAGARGLVQWVEVSKLLPQSVQDVLFRQAVAR